MDQECGYGIRQGYGNNWPKQLKGIDTITGRYELKHCAKIGQNYCTKSEYGIDSIKQG